MMPATMFRSRETAVLGGVCGGLSILLSINPVYIRAFFVVLAFGGGIGLLLYLLLWLILPLDGQIRAASLADNVHAGSQQIAWQTHRPGDDLWGIWFGAQARLSLLAGAALIVIGLIFLLPNLNLAELPWLNFDLIWPILLIIGGLALLLRRPNGEIGNGRKRST